MQLSTKIVVIFVFLQFRILGISRFQRLKNIVHNENILHNVHISAAPGLPCRHTPQFFEFSFIK